MIYNDETRPRFLEQGMTVAQAMKAAADEWNKLTPKKKEKYEDLAVEVIFCYCGIIMIANFNDGFILTQTFYFQTHYFVSYPRLIRINKKGFGNSINLFPERYWKYVFY